MCTVCMWNGFLVVVYCLRCRGRRRFPYVDIHAMSCEATKDEHGKSQCLKVNRMQFHCSAVTGACCQTILSKLGQTMAFVGFYFAFPCPDQGLASNTAQGCISHNIKSPHSSLSGTLEELSDTISWKILQTIWPAVLGGWLQPVI